MKDKLINLKNSPGVSTMEMLIALTVITFTISAVTTVVFGNQSIAVDTETTNDAIYMVHRDLENARNLAEENFNSLTNTTIQNGIFEQSHIVSYISPCLLEITTSATWQPAIGRQLQIFLSSLISSPTEALALGGNCLSTPILEAWLHPDTHSSADISPSGNDGTDVDVAIINGQKYAFLTARKLSPGGGNDDWHDFFVFDIEQNPPVIIGSIDTGPGLNALNVAGNFAYVANHSANNQLQVIDVSDPSNPVLVAERSLPGVAGEKPEGKAVYYYQEKVYISTLRTVGHEFHVFDVSSPGNPQWQSSVEVNRNVNDIVVRNGLAYLATGPGAASNNPFKIFDVNPLTEGGGPNPNYLNEIGALVTPSPGGAGTALFVLGPRAYLGLERSSTGHELFIIDIANPAQTPLPIIISKDLDSENCNIWNPTSGNYQEKKCIGSNESVNGIFVSGNLAFVVTSNNNATFQVWNVPSLTNRSAYSYPQTPTGLDFFDNWAYVSNRSQNMLRIICDNPPPNYPCQ